MWDLRGSRPCLVGLVAASLLPACSVAAAVAQDRKERPAIAGRVVSASSEQPIPGVRINLLTARKSVSTDSVGRFRFENLRPGVYQVEAVLLGFAPLTAVVRLEEGERKELEFRTDSAGQLLPTIYVDGEAKPDLIKELTKFERRMAFGTGRFITRQQILDRRPIALMDMIRLLPGVRTNCYGTSCRVLLNHDPRRCGPAIFIDEQETSMPVLESTVPSSVEGIEIYRGPSETPPELNTETARCGGAIVIWTRRGRSP